MEEKTIQGIKTIFVPAHIENLNIEKSLKKLNIKNKKIGLVSSIQYLDYLDKAKTYLEKQGNKVFIGGQILGCNVAKAIKIKDKVDLFIFIGSGEFHSLELIDKTKKDTIFVNPYTEKVSKFDNKDLKRKRKGKLSKYFMSKKIGILVSTKPGQETLSLALKFAKSCKKEAYIFIGNDINMDGLEDFNDIEMWVNTACPRIEGKNVISLRDIIR